VSEAPPAIVAFWPGGWDTTFQRNLVSWKKTGSQMRAGVTLVPTSLAFEALI
jgi:hypothetical protein